MDQFIYRIWKKLHLIISSEDAYETRFPPTPRLKGKFGIQKNATARYDSAMVPQLMYAKQEWKHETASVNTESFLSFL